MQLVLCGMSKWDGVEENECNEIWHEKGVIHICTDLPHPAEFEHECECGEVKWLSGNS